MRHCDKTEERADAPLSALGFRQAEMIVPNLDQLGVDFIVTSPYLRAKQSVMPFIAATDIPVIEDPRFAEWQLSGTLRDDWKDVLLTALANPDSCAEGGETATQAFKRSYDGLKDHRKKGHCLIVTHGGLLTLLLAHFGRGRTMEDLFALRSPDLFAVEGANWRMLDLPEFT